MSTEYFVETRDIYLEILQEAQRVEDRKLVLLIYSRLQEMGQPDMAADANDNVIPFPAIYTPAPAPVTAPEPSAFWPRFAIVQACWLLTGYIAVLLGGLLI